jgi:virulence-associated protein VapD
VKFFCKDKIIKVENYDCYECFPVKKGSNESTAKKWAKSDIEIELPNHFNKIKFYDIETRMNREVFKAIILTEKGNFIIDIYAKPALDIINNSNIEDGIICGNYAFISNNKFVSIVSEEYKKYQNEQFKKSIKPITKFKLFNTYKNRIGDTLLYLGQYYFMENINFNRQTGEVYKHYENIKKKHLFAEIKTYGTYFKWNCSTIIEDLNETIQIDNVKDYIKKHTGYPDCSGNYLEEITSDLCKENIQSNIEQWKEDYKKYKMLNRL